jgi:hypothetical protein
MSASRQLKFAVEKAIISTRLEIVGARQIDRDLMGNTELP